MRVDTDADMLMGSMPDVFVRRALPTLPVRTHIDDDHTQSKTPSSTTLPTVISVSQRIKVLRQKHAYIICTSASRPAVLHASFNVLRTVPRVV